MIIRPHAICLLLEVELRYIIYMNGVIDGENLDDCKYQGCINKRKGRYDKQQ